MTTVRDWMDQFMAKDESNLKEIKQALETLKMDSLFNKNYPELNTYIQLIDDEFGERKVKRW